MASNLPDKNKKLALSLVMLVFGMICLTAASVPLYNLFCSITGYGGTTGTAAKAPEQAATREITVRFNAITDKNLPWRFTPNDPTVTLRIGEERLISYTAENISDKPVTGRAIYNVTPHAAGPYFMKIACFCFENQTLQPGEKIDMPVSFFIDTELLNDKNLKNLNTVNLSYTFFLSKDQ